MHSLGVDRHCHLKRRSVAGVTWKVGMREAEMAVCCCSTFGAPRPAVSWSPSYFDLQISYPLVCLPRRRGKHTLALVLQWVRCAWHIGTPVDLRSRCVFFFNGHPRCPNAYIWKCTTLLTPTSTTTKVCLPRRRGKHIYTTQTLQCPLCTVLTCGTHTVYSLQTVRPNACGKNNSEKPL